MPISRTRHERKLRPSTLSDIQLAQVRALFDPICLPHPDPKISSKLRYGYGLDRLAVIYFESRPNWTDRSKWMDHNIAKFRFTKRTGLWSLYCMFRDLKWRAYEPLPCSHNLGELLAEVKRDPTGIFFG